MSIGSWFLVVMFIGLLLFVGVAYDAYRIQREHEADLDRRRMKRAASKIEERR